MNAMEIGRTIAGSLTAVGLIAAAGPWIAFAIVLGVLAYKADAILPAYGDLRIKLAQAKWIAQGCPAPMIELPARSGRAASTRHPPAKRVTNKRAAPPKITRQQRP
jgi:hypothetical protein